MLTKVDKHSGVPAYIQIMNIVKKEIMFGRLKIGDQLPPVRELASRFGVNTNTVLKAFEKLHYEGLLEAEQGVGYFVKESHIVNKKLVELIEGTASELKKNNVNLPMAKILLEEVWKDA
jgi:GntR family transcriptional regulator